MNCQHYFKKLDKFAVCAFKADKGFLEIEYGPFKIQSHGVLDINDVAHLVLRNENPRLIELD